VTIANETGTRKIEIARTDQELVHFANYELQLSFETEDLKGNLYKHIWVKKSDVERVNLKFEILHLEVVVG
jgi:hypothetical protein